MIEKFTDEFKKGEINCAQMVLLHFANRCGLDKKMAKNLSVGFGGGMREASFCGSVAASYVVLGLVCRDDKKLLEAKFKEFNERYEKCYKSKICKEILEASYLEPKGLEKIEKNSLFTTICPRLTSECVEILESILAKV
ncbi:C-GCAxxG-C-C family protein [Campylobacter geochelonis]|uniref:C_GCAxxG_C_C family protein n=1 Tax=Campylobacter geochelonis TaxID=1780362 RepID=A0A128EMF5_9BACT|nr:C-GCAxxG-C-C family protein [Campylobacter geochelonis]QKF70600.1 C_GCAxxG_C_C family protein [Campylobacter geochelonis]CZE45954.1 C_GCAxxG_C_C family protein [Campylobacter geochelonis]CZE46680.1 C_GCAxxG_C_C family protein [Campylobacter geochelonis]CZE50357.1 C_GCAxxG_C_C family protein [Campylobacter geochelonis]